MSRWFRWYRGTSENPKFRLAARNGNVTLVTVMSVWQALLEDAAHEDHRGICEKREDFIAAALDLDDNGTVQGALRGLEYVGLISIGMGAITICNWAKWQYEQDVTDPTNAERQRRYRERKASDNGSVTARNGAVTSCNTPDTDTDTDTEEDILGPSTLRTAKPKPKDEEILAFEAFNELAADIGIPKAQSFTAERRSKIRQRLNECGGLSGWLDAMGKIRGSPFLCGENDRGWKANLDFVLQKTSFTRLMEGSYDRQTPSRPAANSKPSLRDGFAFLDAVTDETIRRAGGLGEDGGEADSIGLPRLR